MSVRPVFANLSINSIFVVKGIVFFSFCNPSRGPTSMSLTRSPAIWRGCPWEVLRVGSTAVASPRSCRTRRLKLLRRRRGRRNDIVVVMAHCIVLRVVCCLYSGYTRMRGSLSLASFGHLVGLHRLSLITDISC